MHRGCLITSLLGMLALYGCYRSDIADPPGWTCNQVPGYCAIESGGWEDIKIGMTNADALNAVCKTLARGIISTEDDRRTSFALGTTWSNPVEMVNGRCSAKAFELKQTEPLWSIQPKHIRCDLFIQRREIWTEFDKNGRLKRLVMYCPFPDF